jgi:hypothetical protein
MGDTWKLKRTSGTGSSGIMVHWDEIADRTTVVCLFSEAIGANALDCESSTEAAIDAKLANLMVITLLQIH